MAVREILLLGDERLYQVSQRVEKSQINEAAGILADLRETMAAFRDKFGFSRAMAAPQIGAFKRIVYLSTGDRIIGFINPEMEFASDEQFELWDDCMSFPGLEVRLRRYQKVRIRYRDIHWKPEEVFFEGDLAELIQHECDHLDGILAVQRALNSRSFRMNSKRAMCY